MELTFHENGLSITHGNALDSSCWNDPSEMPGSVEHKPNNTAQ